MLVAKKTNLEKAIKTEDREGEGKHPMYNNINIRHVLV